MNSKSPLWLLTTVLLTTALRRSPWGRHLHSDYFGIDAAGRTHRKRAGSWRDLISTKTRRTPEHLQHPAKSHSLPPWTA